MAIAIRGTTPAATATASDPISVSLTGARQPQTGDLLVIINCNNFYTLSVLPTPTVGGSTTGVTSISGATADGGTNGAHIKAWYFVVTSTGDVTVACDHGGAGDEEKGLAVYVLSGTDTANPIDGSGGATNTGGTTHNAPSVSPASSDAFLICHANPGGGPSNSSYTEPGGMTETYDVAITALCIGGATLQLSASGATGTKTFTPDTSETTNAEISVAIKTGGAAVVEVPGYLGARLPGRIGPDRKVYLPRAISAESLTGGAVDLAGMMPIASQHTGDAVVSFSAAGHVDAASQHTGLAGLSLPLAGHVDSASQHTSSLRLVAGTAGHVDAASDVVAALNAGFSLSGHVDSASALTGSEVVSYSLAGHVDAASGLTGALNVALTLQGKIDSASLLTGNLASGQPLTGHVDVASGMTGLLSIPAVLAGNINTAALLTGDVTVTSFQNLAGSVNASVMLTGPLSLSQGLTGTIPAATLLTGDVQAAHTLDGIIPAALTLSGPLTSDKNLTGHVWAAFTILNIDVHAIKVTGIGDLQRRWGLQGELRHRSSVSASSGVRWSLGTIRRSS